MSLTINGEEHGFSPSTLTALLETLGYNAELVATAVNGRFVSKAERINMHLNDGDDIEILAPMQGG